MYSYRVLTPTMYRSRMATARQAVSMDYDDDSGAVKKARLRREGPAMRGPSPLLRPGKLLRAQRSSGENSFDLELGASATRVHQLPAANTSLQNTVKYRRLSPNIQQQISTGKVIFLVQWLAVRWPYLFGFVSLKPVRHLTSPLPVKINEILGTYK